MTEVMTMNKVKIDQDKNTLRRWVDLKYKGSKSREKYLKMTW